MQIKVLGARQGESRHSHFNSLLIDGIIALDAGSITSTLTLDEQAAIQYILLTHQHYDHIKDLATFGFNRIGRGQVTVFCTDAVRATIEATILNRDIWLNFFIQPTPEEPTYVHVPIESGEIATFAGYRILSVPSKHPKPVTGYEITSPDGRTVLYTGDAGPGSGTDWASSSPDLLITEVTLPNAFSDQAGQFGHLTPSLLVQELESFRSVRGSIPPVAIIHRNPFHELQIAMEISELACNLANKVWLPGEGDTITVGLTH